MHMLHEIRGEETGIEWSHSAMRHNYCEYNTQIEIMKGYVIRTEKGQL